MLVKVSDNMAEITYGKVTVGRVECGKVGEVTLESDRMCVYGMPVYDFIYVILKGRQKLTVEGTSRGIMVTVGKKSVTLAAG